MTKASGYYTYLISSLPMLRFGAKPPFSFEKFLNITSESVSENDIKAIKTCAGIDESIYDKTQSTLGKWRAFETTLRNALVKIRASRKHIDPDKYLRHDKHEDPYINNIAMNAYKNPSILESEKILDEERWHALEELSLGHYFDLDFLIVYANKLLILEKWERVRTSDKSNLVEEVLHIENRP